MALILHPFTLEGLAVLLRPLAATDAPALAAAAAESREHYRFSHVPDGPEAAVEYVTRALAARDRGERIPFAVEFGGRVAGTTSYSDFQPWKWPDGSPY